MTNRQGIWRWFGWSVLLSIAAIPVIALRWLMIPIGVYLVYLVITVSWILPLLFILIPIFHKTLVQILSQIRTRWVAISWLFCLFVLIVIFRFWSVVKVVEHNFFLVLAYGYFLSLFWGLGSASDRQRIRESLGKHRATNILLLLSTGLVLLGSVELYLRVTTLKSHGFAVTLGNQAWEARYMRPINSLGYRAYEPIPADDDQTSILVLGDSFAVGNGIKRIDDIFTYQLDRILPDDYVVNLAGRPGISPTTEYVNRYPYKPDILVLSHVPNDIDHAIVDEPLLQNYHPTGMLDWWIKRYYIVDFLYWYGYVANNMRDELSQNLQDAYQNDAIWSAHAEKLQEFIIWAEDTDTRLIVIVFPNLENTEANDVGNDKIETLFTDAGISVIRMEDSVESLTVKERTVNRFDAHPSVLVHRLAAEALANVILE